MACTTDLPLNGDRYTNPAVKELRGPTLLARQKTRHIQRFKAPVTAPGRPVSAPSRMPEKPKAAPKRFTIASLRQDGGVDDFEHVTQTDGGLENICGRLARGTLIKAASGAIAIEDLRPGDMILTKDNDLQPVRWIGSCMLQPAKDETERPICIKADALGYLRPDQDLLVTPSFRLLINHPSCAALFGSPEALAPAANLLDGGSILQVQTSEDIMFYNLLFDSHQIILANGLETESYHPGNFGVSAMSFAMQSHMLAIFPHLGGDLAHFGKTARPILKGFEADVLKVG